jgi:hypothetical protein
MLSLLYLSRSCIPAERRPAELAAILDVASKRNLTTGITGALVHSALDFVQVLEGPDAAVIDVMGSIIVDPRHHDVRIVRRDQVESRSFPHWGMTELASSAAIERCIHWIKSSRDETDFEEASRTLVALMRAAASARV